MSPFQGSDTMTLLHAGMKTASMNHRLIANNIVNANTPNFTPVELDFQSALRDVLAGRERFSLRKTHPGHVESSRNLLNFKPLATSSKNDYNKVDLEHEMAKLSENTGRYSMYSALLSKRMRSYRDMLTNMR